MSDTGRDHSGGGAFFRQLVGVLLPPLLILIGVLFIVLMVVTKPTPPKKPHDPIQGLVEVMPLQTGNHRINIRAMGEVVAARRINLKARVAGEIIEVHPEFIEGGRIHAGEILLRIDPIDYELALEQARADLAQAEYELQLEQGRQVVARREWELLNEQREATEDEKALALRVPHLKRIRADQKAAEANLRRAEVNLERTVVRAPFDALVLNRLVELGGQVRDQDVTAVLADLSEYWVGVSVPVDRLQWMDIPSQRGQPGSSARVYSEPLPDRTYDGEVIRLEGELENMGRMARLIVAIRDPLGVGQDRSPADGLLLGSYVRVDIQGTELKDVYRIPRSAYRENDEVWLMTPENRLKMSLVTPLWKGQDVVMCRGDILPGEQLVLTDLANPAPNMILVTTEPDNRDMP